MTMRNRNCSSNSPENRQRTYPISYSVPYHPIVTWKDWLSAIHAMHETEAMLMRSAERAATPEEIREYQKELKGKGKGEVPLSLVR
jgi:hypothetical protein